MTGSRGGPEEVRAPRTRSEYRAFVKEHHPDRGGDPEVFRAGMAAWRRRRGLTEDVVLTTHRRRRGLGMFLDAWQRRRVARRRAPRVE